MSELRMYGMPLGREAPVAYVSAFCPSMASSLASECTPLKLKYDACFNAWFEGYLEPVIEGPVTEDKKKDWAAMKAKEYDEQCGKLWESYRTCLQGALEEKGITELLQQAQKEDPLLDQPPPPSEMVEKSN